MSTGKTAFDVSSSTVLKRERAKRDGLTVIYDEKILARVWLLVKLFIESFCHTDTFIFTHLYAYKWCAIADYNLTGITLSDVWNISALEYFVIYFPQYKLLIILGSIKKMYP